MNIFRGISVFSVCLLSAASIVVGSEIAIAQEQDALTTKDLISNGYFIKDESSILPGEKQGFGGALLSVQGHMVEIQRKGQIFEINQDTLEASQMPVSVPFTDFAERSFGERGLSGVKAAAFDQKNSTLYVSTVKIAKDCAYSTIYSIQVEKEPFTFSKAKEFLSLDDCVPVPPLPADFPAITASEKFDQPNLSQASGKLIVLQNGKLLWSIGNYGDKWRNSSEMLADGVNPKVYWGKTLLVDENKNIQIFSTGHRNIQGLYQAPNGAIVASEHGPEGGDELNILLEGKYFGWPFSSLGHDYSAKDKTYVSSSEFPPVTRLKTSKSTAPYFAWVPSVAPSQIIEVSNKSKLSLWRNNFLMGTLKDASIHRIVINPENNSVVLDEKIPVEMRIRDMTWGKQSSVFVLSDDSSIHKLTFSPRAK